MNISRILAIILSLFTMLSTLLHPSSPEPIFRDGQEPQQKTVFDEGELIVKRYDIVVAPDGNDKNSGTLESPLQTVRAAKEKAKLLKDADCGHVTVWFREGTYVLEETLVFDEADLSDVTYRSCPNEKVVFSGAKAISDFTETTVNGVRAFTADWAVADEADYFNALYNGEKRLSRAVYPKTGTFAVADAKDIDAYCPDNSYFPLHAAFYAAPADLKSFHNPQDVDVHILHFWNDELLPISSVDTSTGRVAVQKPSAMRICKGDRYVFENVFEALSAPGEWYLDRTAGKLYYLPLPGETTKNTVLRAAVCEQLVTLRDCSNVEFRGITFSDTTWEIRSGSHFNVLPSLSDEPRFSHVKYFPSAPQACYDAPCAVELNRCDSVQFTDCTFARIGSSALQFGAGTVNSGANASLFSDIGGNAVYIKGVNEKGSPDCTHGISVTDCHIKTYGRIFNNAIGVLLVHAYDCEISHNEIHDGFYTAISSGWVWGYTENITDNIRIADNLIYDIGQGWLSDMGGIYTLGVQPHSVITGNLIHDVGCYEGDGGYGGWGIYLDEGSSYILVEKNLCYRCSSEGFHQHYGQDNTVQNNIFALNGEGQLRVSRKEEHNSLFLYRNIFLGDNAPMYYDNYDFEFAGKFKDDNNLYWDISRGAQVLSGDPNSSAHRLTVRETQKIGYYNNATFADPMFRDPENGDFTLAKNSPAFPMGFEEFSVAGAGTLTLF